MKTLDGEINNQAWKHGEKLFMKTQRKINNNDGMFELKFNGGILVIVLCFMFCINFSDDISYIYSIISMLIASTISSIYVLFFRCASVEDMFKWDSCTYSKFNALVEEYARSFKRNGVDQNNNTVLVLWRTQNDNIDTVAMVCGLQRSGGSFMLIDPRATGFYGMVQVLRDNPPDFILASNLLCRVIFLAAWFLKLPNFKYITSSALLHGMDKNNKNNVTKNLINDGSNLSSTVHNHTAAAVMFTSGSTGIPKIIHLSQFVLLSQAKSYGMLLRNALQYGDNKSLCNNNIKILQTTFNFPIFDYVNGFTTILPYGDFNNVQRLDVKQLLVTMRSQNVNTGFMSPSVWKRLLRYCRSENKKIPSSVKFTASGGSPLHPKFHSEIIDCFDSQFGQHISVYAMTEGLPLASIGSYEVLNNCSKWTKIGGGICLGRAIDGLKVKITPLSFINNDEVSAFHDNDADNLDSDTLLLCCPNPKEIINKNAAFQKFGEISLSGNNLTLGSNKYHDTGDVGYLDLADRIWLCGRKSHIVRSKSGRFLCSVALESIVNYLPSIEQCALVSSIEGRVVLFIEPTVLFGVQFNFEVSDILLDVKKILQKHSLLQHIDQIRILDENYCRLPTDPRHKSKILRSWFKMTGRNMKFHKIATVV